MLSLGESISPGAWPWPLPEPEPDTREPGAARSHEPVLLLSVGSDELPCGAYAVEPLSTP